MKNRYYSQRGQDFLVDQLIKSPKVAIEIGCIDGDRLSNTKYFEENYDTLCFLFEPNRNFEKMIIKNRPNSIFRPYAISDYNSEDSLFYSNKNGSFSNLDNKFLKQYSTREGFEKYELQKNTITRTLDSVIDEFEIKNIDFLSIDIDGDDIKVLYGLDFNKVHPLILCIELNDFKNDQIAYIDYLKKNSKFKYFFILDHDLFCILKTSTFFKFLRIRKTFTIKPTKAPFAKLENDLTEELTINGVKILHNFYRNRYFWYKKLTYRLNKIRLIFKKSN